MIVRFLLLAAVWIVPLSATAGLVGPLNSSATIDTSNAVTVREPSAVLSAQAASREVHYPWGGRQLFPEYRLVATYGSPAHAALGVLGERDIAGSIEFVKQLANQYRVHTSQQVLPAFEIIASVASAVPTKDNDYSQELDKKTLRKWVQAAGEAGVYVVLDLQPGRESFLSQAKRLEEFLLQPHVGLALDPEWRLKSNQVHLQQIGSVHAGEVNTVARWLANLTKDHKLPQKVFMIHQFNHSMISQRHKLKTHYPELAYIIHMDGQGPQGSKEETYQALVKDFPKNARTGWKNFYDEDETLRSAPDTINLSPSPWFISYQ